jgi:methionyl-tRNA synthetase
MNRKFYVTTAIDYTNDVIHIGHSYQKILADVFARYHRLLEEKTFFLTGTDEHGQKVEKSAKEKGIPPQEFVDRIAAEDKAEWDKLNISYDRFIRTTDPDHIKLAQEFYLKAKKNGDIYLKKYTGLYCEGCELFYDGGELVDGKCPLHPNREIQRIEEENYFFKLSKYQSFLENLLKDGSTFVVPDSKRKEVLSFVKKGLKDFSVSRQNVKWGIPVPDDPNHTIYVWFDALINYISGAPDFWPANIHILGKDNQRFHAIFWPAMLKSTGYELPKTILVHDFISLNGQKISKSLGNIIRPSELIEKFGVDAVRYYFLRYGPLTNDVDISIEKIQEVYNADLANGLGNLVARITQLAEQNLTKGTRPEPKGFPKEYTLAIENFELNKAIGFIWKKIQALDQKINETEPYKLVKEKPESGKKVIFELTQELYLIGRLLNPFLPETSAKIKEAVITNRKPKTLFPRLK